MTDHERTADALRARRAEQLGQAHQDSLSGRMRYWPHIHNDLPSYLSPITGKLIDGKRARREDLKSSGCVPWEPEMKDLARRNYQENEAKLDRIIGEGAERVYQAWPDSKKRELQKELVEQFNRRFEREK